ncbi:MAG TPA: lysophospholipid acyltransferase family protein [Pirellulaceae bacterium]|nr:lysophospholipid acyltransferase family protein [Pirellulaceae bacterium]
MPRKKRPTDCKHRLRKRLFRDNALLQAGLGFGARGLLQLWLGTMRVWIEFEDPALDPRQGGLGAVFCIWHEHLLFLGHRFRDCGLSVMISKSADGELISRIVSCLGYRTVRGSTGASGSRAVRELLHDARLGSLVLTPDGPRGPRRVFQAGAVYLASRLGLPMAAAGCAYERPWRARTWDQLVLPRPFSRAVLVVGRGLKVPADADQDDLQIVRQQAEGEMGVMNDRAEALLQRWVRTGETPRAARPAELPNVAQRGRLAMAAQRAP